MHLHPQFIFRSPLNSKSCLLDNSIFNEALYLSTPNLYNESQKEIADVKELEKIKISLHKYQTRSRNRCTPFGLFAGLSVGKFGIDNNIILNTNYRITLKRKTRLDMNVLCALAQEFAKQLFIKPYLKFYPNNSIYQLNNYYRFVEYYYNNTQRIHKITKVDFSEYLQIILQQAQHGKTLNELANLLVSSDITKDEALAFVNELVESQ
jgi:hypothetical protein